MHSLEVTDSLRKILAKLAKENPQACRAVTSKMREIVDNPCHLKPLRGEMHGSRRVHIGSFVLTYELDGEIIRFLDFNHHDNVYI